MRATIVAGVAALAVTGVGGAALSPSAQLRTYLQQVRPINAAEDTQIVRASSAWDALDNTEASFAAGAVRFRAISMHLTALANRMRLIKPPAGMRGPQATYVAALRAEAHGLGVLANGYASGSVSDERLAMFCADGAVAAADEHHWRDELTVQLRRAQVTVPLWVKQVGKLGLTFIGFGRLC